MLYRRFAIRTLSALMLFLALAFAPSAPAWAKTASEAPAQTTSPWTTPEAPASLMTPAPMTLPLQPRIVNGVNAITPGIVALLDANTGQSFCTGTLVGCNTVLTAAHCVCFGDGDQCQGGGGQLESPANIEVFLHSAGVFGVQSIHVPTDYVFGERSDVAVLRLSQTVTGVRPFAINTSAPVANGTTGFIYGYGLTEGDDDDSGILRTGQVVTSACTVVPDNPHVCWRFQDPMGPAGQDSNTCSGDSGGPLFVVQGANLVLAGVTSGGTSFDCETPDSSWDAEVHFNRNFIQNAAAGNLGTSTCGNLPHPLDVNNADFGFIGGTLSGGTPNRSFQMNVPAGTQRLRVALNGEDGPFVGGNDFDLYVKRGATVSTSNFDCSSERDGTFEYCEIVNPQSGTWSFLAHRFQGSGEFQLIATILGSTGGGGGGSSTCVPGAKTLCIDDDPGDRRFKVEVAYDTVLGGGRAGDADATPLASLGIDRGGIFSFFNAQNPEMLVKILDGCNNNGNFWVFYAATTTVGFEMTVTDTESGAVKTYGNPDQQAAVPVTDTRAFATCP